MKKIIIAFIIFITIVLGFVFYSSFGNTTKISEQAQNDVSLYQDKFDARESYIYTESYADLGQTFQFEETQTYDSETDSLFIEYHEANVGNQNTYDIEISYTLNSEDEVIDYQAKYNGEDATDDETISDKLILYRDEEFAKPQSLIDKVYNSVSGDDLNIEYEDGFYTNVGVSSADEFVTQSFDNQAKIMNSTYEAEETTTIFTLEFLE